MQQSASQMTSQSTEKVTSDTPLLRSYATKKQRVTSAHFAPVPSKMNAVAKNDPSVQGSSGSVSNRTEYNHSEGILYGAGIYNPEQTDGTRQGSETQLPRRLPSLVKNALGGSRDASTENEGTAGMGW